MLFLKRPQINFETKRRYILNGLGTRVSDKKQKVREEAIQDFKHFNSKSLLTQAVRGEKVFAIIPAFKKTF